MLVSEHVAVLRGHVYVLIFSLRLSLNCHNHLQFNDNSSQQVDNLGRRILLQSMQAVHLWLIKKLDELLRQTASQGTKRFCCL